MFTILFSNVKTIFSKLKSVAKPASEALPPASQDPESFDFGIARVSQGTLNNPNYKYACNVTAHKMMNEARGAAPMTLDAYYEACIKLGAIRADCWILDYDKMCVAQGIKGSFRKSEVNADLIKQNLLAGRPMHVHVGGHFEMICGYEHRDGHLLFKLLDPGYQGDTHLDSKTWECFHFEGIKKVNSKNKDGSKRKATSVGWYI